MPFPLLNTASIMMCQHGGRCQPLVLSPRVKVSGLPCLVMGTAMPIAGCGAGPNIPGTASCTMAQVLNGSTRIRSMGLPLVTAQSGLLATPSGLPINIADPGQRRVTGF
jgi:hypothetical protein